MTAKTPPLTRDESLTAAIEANRGKLRAVIRGMLKDQVEVDDVLQDVYEEFVASYDLGTTFETVSAWLVRVAQNKVLDRFRRKKTQEEYRLFVQDTTADGADPGNEWMRDWFREEILDALESLPPEQRLVFVRHELEGKSFEDISAETGVGVNTLLSRKRYAVLALREHLQEIYDELE